MQNSRSWEPTPILTRRTLQLGWGLRNDAAHGNYDEYSKQQVMLMIDSIRDFIARNPE